MPKNHIDLSIVFNVHKEANAMQATLRSINDAILYYENSTKLVTELIVVLDSPDDATKRYIKRASETLLRNITNRMIIEVDCKDLGMARNRGIAAAHGDVVAVMDADDVYTETYLYEADQALRSSDSSKTIIHPGYVISFDSHDELWRPLSSDDPTFEPAMFARFNPWPSQALAYKETFTSFPYAATGADSGFGPEDWHWNCKTYFEGYTHRAIEKVAYFYRRKDRSSLAALHQSSLLPSTSMLAYDGYKKYIRDYSRLVGNEPQTELLKNKLKRHTPRMIKRALKSTIYRRPSYVPISASIYPHWLIEEWTRLHEYDHKIFPSDSIVNKPVEYSPQVDHACYAYWRIVAEIGSHVDYAFFVPWLRTGGADLVVLNYVRAIKVHDKKARIVVFATEPSRSIWSELLPSDVVFIELNTSFYSQINFNDQTRLVATIMYQFAPRTIHVINSPLGFRMLTEYSAQLSKHTHLFVSAFSVDQLINGQKVHYLYDHLKHSIPNITRILTDNTAVIKDLTTRFGFDEDKFHTHFQPATPPDIENDERLSTSIIDTSNLKILWAARLDRAKRADILLQIAERCLERGLAAEFHVYGSALIDTSSILEDLKGLPNVVYEGPFDRGIWQLPVDEFDMFLMTSQWEGMPNALLQATSCGLPVMTSEVGGIGDFINERTGFPIKSFDDIVAYTDMIENIISNKSILKDKITKAQEELHKKHTWEAFTKTLMDEAGYLRDGKDV